MHLSRRIPFFHTILCVWKIRKPYGQRERNVHGQNRNISQWEREVRKKRNRRREKDRKE